MFLYGFKLCVHGTGRQCQQLCHSIISQIIPEREISRGGMLWLYGLHDWLALAHTLIIYHKSLIISYQLCNNLQIGGTEQAPEACDRTIVVLASDAHPSQ